MGVGDAHALPGFSTPVLTQLFFPKPPSAFLTCFCRGESRKYAGKKKIASTGDRTHKPPGRESDTLTTEPPGQGDKILDWSKLKQVADDTLKCI